MAFCSAQNIIIIRVTIACMLLFSNIIMSYIYFNNSTFSSYSSRLSWQMPSLKLTIVMVVFSTVYVDLISAYMNNN